MRVAPVDAVGLADRLDADVVALGDLAEVMPVADHVRRTLGERTRRAQRERRDQGEPERGRSSGAQALAQARARGERTGGGKGGGDGGCGDDGRWEAGNGRWEAGNGRWEAGNGRREAGNGRREKGVRPNHDFLFGGRADPRPILEGEMSRAHSCVARSGPTSGGRVTDSRRVCWSRQGWVRRFPNGRVKRLGMEV